MVLALLHQSARLQQKIATAQKNINTDQRFFAESVQLVLPEVLARLRAQSAPQAAPTILRMR